MSEEGDAMDAEDQGPPMEGGAPARARNVWIEVDDLRAAMAGLAARVDELEAR